MERHPARVAVAALLLALVAGCADGNEHEHDAAVAVVAADLVDLEGFLEATKRACRSWL